LSDDHDRNKRNELNERLTFAKAMNDKKLFFTSLIILVLLISFDTIAKVSSFYYFYPNADIFMHFTGGLSITALAISVLRYTKMANKFNIFLVIILVSFLWEYIEFTIGKNVLINTRFWIDTFIDLLMNALGGIIAYICFYKIPLTQQKNLLK
jgi:hypothetical protein